MKLLVTKSYTNEMKHQNLLQSLAKFMASQPMKKFIQLLVSVSLFSFLFSCSSSFFIQYSLNFSFYAFPCQLLSHAMDKNYVFLICNGIFFVLLIKSTSSEEEEEEEEEEKAEEEGTKNGFLNEFQEAEPLCTGAQASYLETSNEEVHARHEDEELVSIKASECHRPSLNVENSNLELVQYKQDESTEEGRILDQEKEEGGVGSKKCSRTYDIVEADNCEENDDMGPENELLLEEEEEEEVAEESDEPLNKLSTEELNKKFEEFIRKMKEEIRIEARQQLVLVK